MTIRPAIHFICACALALTVAGCSSGYLYENALPMQFQDFDYTFPTKTALADPQVSYIDQGSGPRTLILVHGLASNAGFWRYNIAELSKTNRVIAVDLPGYGKSDKGDYPYTMTFFAETVARLISHLGLKQVVYVGHSMGGQIGILLTLRHPEMVEKLVLVSPAGIERFDRGEGEWLRKALTVEGISSATEEMIRRNLAMNFYSWDDRWEWMVEERARMAKTSDMKEFSYAVVKSVGAMLDEPTTGKLKDISRPTLLIYGRYDGLIPNPYLHPGFPADVFNAGARLIPQCVLREVDDAGHMVQIEKPDQVNGEIALFLKR